jgi:glutamate--cysteine ligase
VTSALLSDQAAGEAAMAAVEPLWTARPAAGHADRADQWVAAARRGPADAALARASRECFEAARGAFARQDTPGEIAAAVDAFVDDYVTKDRCPADDLLEEVK